MRNADIVAGNVETAHGRSWTRPGHSNLFGVADVRSEKSLALGRTTGAAVRANADAAAEADAIMLSVHGARVP